MERKAKAKGGFTGWNRTVAAAVAAAALVSMMMLAGCPTEEDSIGGGGGGIPAELIGKWEGTTGDAYAQGKYIEFTSDKKLLVRETETGNATTYTVNSVSGGTVEIQSANATISDGSFNYTLNAAKTELTVSEQSMNGNSVGYATYTKQVSSENPGGGGGGWTAGGNLIGTTWINGTYTIACTTGELTVSGSTRTSSGTWSSGTITFTMSTGGTVSGTYHLNADASKMKITGLTSTISTWNDQEWTKQ